MTDQANRYRLLIIDDNESIHDDLKKILLHQDHDCGLSADEKLLFGTTQEMETEFDVDSAFQGQEGLDFVMRAQSSRTSYALAFVDVRMPPGWDGIETIRHLWRADPELQVVICTAHSDYNWNTIAQELGVSHNFVILKKPFDNIEVKQLAHALTAKWTAMRMARLKMEDLDRQVEERTADLRRTEEKYRAIFEDAVIGIFQASPDGRLLNINCAFAKMHGYDTPEQLLDAAADGSREVIQRRLRIDDNWFRIDLIFFHRRLRCLIIVDLKVGKFSYTDAGQMHLYLNYAREHWMKSGENPPVGLILCAEKGAAEAHYALDNLPNKVLAAEYQTILPDEKLIAKELEKSRRELEARKRLDVPSRHNQ